MATYVESRDYVNVEQTAYDEAMRELLEHNADRTCMAINHLADAIEQLAAAITDQANVRITD
jgi:hypothetical protein